MAVNCQRAPKREDEVPTSIDRKGKKAYRKKDWLIYWTPKVWRKKNPEGLEGTIKGGKWEGVSGGEGTPR